MWARQLRHLHSTTRQHAVQAGRYGARQPFPLSVPNPSARVPGGMCAAGLQQLEQPALDLSPAQSAGLRALSAVPASADSTLQDLTSLLGPVKTGPMVPPLKPVVIVVSGPSGVGKDSVVARLKALREDLYFVVTATSRPRRPNEVEGKDYFFVSKGKFEDWIASDMLLEHALVYGDYKGIPRQQVDDALKAGTDVVLRIDVQGAATVKQLMPEAITIFVAAETEDILVRRLAARQTETIDKLAVRVATARAELDRVHEFDYVVVNGDGALDACVAEMSHIIDAEKCSVKRRYAHEQQLHVHAALPQQQQPTKL